MTALRLLRVRHIVASVVFSAVVMFSSSSAWASPLFWYFTGHTDDGTFATGLFDFSLGGFKDGGPGSAHYHYFNGFFAQVGVYTVTANLEVYLFLQPFSPPGGPYTATDYQLYGFENLSIKGPGGFQTTAERVDAGDCVSPVISLAFPVPPPCHLNGFRVLLNSPQLNVTFDSLAVPIPPTILLLLAGFVMLAARQSSARRSAS